MQTISRNLHSNVFPHSIWNVITVCIVIKYQHTIIYNKTAEAFIQKQGESRFLHLAQRSIRIKCINMDNLIPVKSWRNAVIATITSQCSHMTRCCCCGKQEDHAILHGACGIWHSGSPSAAILRRDHYRGLPAKLLVITYSCY